MPQVPRSITNCQAPTGYRCALLACPACPTQVMSAIEQCAYISASRLRAPHTLTAALDSLTFVRSTRLGHILYVTSQVSS
jgi:hypothetical protein